MPLTPSQASFLATHHDAAMITTSAEGVPRVARVAVAMVDSKLWSSGTQDRRRTQRLRRDPRCTLFVFAPQWLWLALETTVRILDGPDAAEQSLGFFRLLQDKPEGPLSWFGSDLEPDDFLAAMERESRLIYEFDVQRAYGINELPG